MRRRDWKRHKHGEWGRMPFEPWENHSMWPGEMPCNPWEENRNPSHDKPPFEPRDVHHRPPRWSHNRRYAFIGIAILVALLSFLFLIGVSVAVMSLMNLPRVQMHPYRFLSMFCAIPLAFFVVVSTLGGVAFRRFGGPLADIISAADAVAGGDLSVRVRVNRRGPLRNLALSFNRMTEKLAQAEQQRRNMTADVAHELRTPLHIIQGNLEGMLDGVYEPDPENLSTTLDETRLLARLVADLQTLTLAEAGQLPLHPTRFPIGDLLNDVVTSFANQAEAKKINLEAIMDKATASFELEADFDRLDQVFSNLVANALRHTPAGGQISLRAALTAKGVQICVVDNGAGIAGEDIPFVFDRFWKGDRSRKRGEGSGSGLGLAIARQIVRMHGGSIGVESSPGSGSTFMVDLGAQISPAQYTSQG